ncbi:phospholipase A2-like [Hyperolius riggenbachi]|uniref:phospholipase A2-like n=1 Tax=Hyperolius riggenbachi TaxID=752182 RepID=UPI0035A29E24
MHSRTSERKQLSHQWHITKDSPMTLQLFLLFLIYNCLNGEQNNTHIRHKRALLDLAGMIQCRTGRSSLSYLGYGCYCGIGGRGMPMDRTDRCCHAHDCCYGFAEQAGCVPASDSYGWSCHNGYITCDRTWDKCQRILCSCDKELADCLRKSRYNKKYSLYPNFLCGLRNMSCRIYKG